MHTSIRKIKLGDEARWRKLWDGYTRFYEREPSEETTQHLWTRLFDPQVPVHGIVAVTKEDTVLGFANYLIHENTRFINPVCYLQDLFVDPETRGAGVGRNLINWLVTESASKKWERLYWHTKENNYPARKLYDTFSPQSGFLLYSVQPKSK